MSDFILLDPEWKHWFIHYIIVSLLYYSMSCGIQVKANLLVAFLRAAKAHALERKQMHVTRRAREEVESTANLDFQIYTIAQVLTLTFCLPLAKRIRVFCLTEHEKPLCSVKPPINFAEVFCHYPSPGRQLSWSIRAERGWRRNCGQARGSARPSTCRLPRQECPLSRHRLARGFRNHFVSVPFIDSTLEGSLSSKSRTETFASHLPAPIWWPFKNPSLL